MSLGKSVDQKLCNNYKDQMLPAIGELQYKSYLAMETRQYNINISKGQYN